MDFFEAVKRRRSIRKYLSDKVPDNVIHKALEMAALAPNSSNTQTWDFHWVKTENIKQKLIEACLFQSAAKSASDLIVVTANSKLWKRSQKSLIEWAKKSNAPSGVLDYYQKLLPIMYSHGPLNLFGFLKWIGITLAGLFRPMPRGPFTRRDMQEVAVKSAALAAQNFVLAISAQGYDSCMMEGFDSSRVLRVLNLSKRYTVVMVIAVGKTAENGTWGTQVRLPLTDVIHVY